MLKQILWRIISNKERLYININTSQSCKFREINLTNIILLSSMHNLSPLLLHNWSPKSNSCTILNTMKRNCQKQFIPELPFCFPKTPLCQWNPQTAVLGTVCEPSAPCVASVSSGPLPRAEKTKPSYQSWQSMETAEGKGTAIPENMEHLQLDSLWKMPAAIMCGWPFLPPPTIHVSAISGCENTDRSSGERLHILSNICRSWSIVLIQPGLK